MRCRHCSAELTLLFADLGTAPPSNAYVSAEQLAGPERWFPLKVFACTHCWLVQTEDFADRAELFAPDYAYFSSYSTSWLQHASRYVAEMTQRFQLNSASKVIEIASNDGYLLQFVKDRGIPCIGIEPTASTAAAARARGIETREEFFGTSLAMSLRAEGHECDLMAANNVLAHVPDINDFVRGFAQLLKPRGVATFEFPHLLRLVRESQFDTLYHEHFSYLSLTAVNKIFAANGLAIVDVQPLDTHGGSLRVFAQRQDSGKLEASDAVSQCLAQEASAGMSTREFYSSFQAGMRRIRNDFVNFLIQAQRRSELVAAYGAAAKGNTLLNYSGIRADLLSWVVDRNPAKVGKFMPGSRIPIVAESELRRQRPAYIVILPWNLKFEIREQLAYVRQWGAKFVSAVPRLSVE